MTPPAAVDGAEFRRIADAVRNSEAGEFINAVNESVDALRYAATLADELARVRADAEYYKWRLTEMIPLFEQARDVLPTISMAHAKLHRLDLSLGNRMDEAGTRTREEFDAIKDRI